VETNVFYYGDNLDILCRYIPDESLDLVEVVLVDPETSREQVIHPVERNGLDQ